MTQMDEQEAKRGSEFAVSLLIVRWFRCFRTGFVWQIMSIVFV